MCLRQGSSLTLARGCHWVVDAKVKSYTPHERSWSHLKHARPHKGTTKAVRTKCAENLHEIQKTSSRLQGILHNLYNSPFSPLPHNSHHSARTTSLFGLVVTAKEIIMYFKGNCHKTGNKLFNRAGKCRRFVSLSTDSHKYGTNTLWCFTVISAEWRHNVWS